MNVVGKGKVEIPFHSGEIKFDNVIYVPGITKNLLLVGTITDGKERFKIQFDSDRVWIAKNFRIPSAHHVVTKDHSNCKNGFYKFLPPKDSINSVSPSISERPTIEFVQKSARSIGRPCVQESAGSMERPATKSLKKPAYKTSNIGTTHTPNSTAELASSLWHQRLGHANLQTLQYMASRVKV